MECYGLPSAPQNAEDDDPEPAEIRAQLKFPRSRLEREVAACIESITDEQRQIYDAILRAAIHTDTVPINKRAFFLEGVAGGGKTWLLNLICKSLRAKGKIVLATAATGIASLLIDKGTTTHKRFKIPINLDESSFCFLEHGSIPARLLLRASLLIIDEGNMLAGKGYKAMDRSFRDITKVDAPFGGLPTLVCGDWRQILAVVKNGTYADTVNETLKRTPMWEHMTKFKLTANLRLQKCKSSNAKLQQEWAETVLGIGNGTVGPFVRLHDEICMPADSTCYDLIHHVYGDIRNDPQQRTPKELGSKAILTPLNDTVDDLNCEIVRMLPGEEHILTSTDEATNDINDGYAPPTEFIHTLTPQGLPPHELILKVGTVVMVIRNLNESAGIQNGTRLIVDKIEQFALKCTIITEGAFFGDKVNIPRIKFIQREDSTFDFKFSRIQFPIKIAFAMTIHKSEGQTLQNVGLYLPEPVYGHGMLYTALSRCTTRKGIKVILGTNQRPPDSPEGFYTANIVFPNVLK